MKSGTTTLFRWLEQHPQVRLPAVKEPDFFSDDVAWGRGIDWYADHFRSVPEGLHTGEASVSYTDPRWAPVAARRLHETVPDARLVCVLRHPVERMRSHYRHEVQRGRERRDFVDAVSDVRSAYVLRSCYASALRPWVETAPPAQLHVVHFESVFADASEWDRLTDFLGLSRVPRPTSAHNVTADKSGFSPAMRVLWDRGLVQRLPRPPRLLRPLARRMLLRNPDAASALNDSARTGVPGAVMDVLHREATELEALVPALRADWDLRT